jgi:hypothetical protein
MAWIGRKKLAFIPLSRTGIQPPDVIHQIGQVRLCNDCFSTQSQPATRYPAPTAPFPSPTAPFAPISTLYLPDWRISMSSCCRTNHRGGKGPARRSRGDYGHPTEIRRLVGAAIVMLGGPGGGQTAQLVGGSTRRRRSG